MDGIDWYERAGLHSYTPEGPAPAQRRAALLRPAAVARSIAHRVRVRRAQKALRQTRQPPRRR